MAGRYPWEEMQQHPTSGSYNVGDVTESGGAAVHLGTSRGVGTFYLICTLLKPDLSLCIILDSEEVAVGWGNGDREDVARQVLLWPWDKGRKGIEELTYQADTPIKRTALWGWT